MTWSFVQHATRAASSALVFFFVAALVEPDEVGLLGVVATWIAITTTLTDVGLNAALIRLPRIEPRHLMASLVLQSTFGFVLAGASVAGAPLVAWLFKTPQAAPLIAATAPAVLFNALGLTHATIAQRELRFRALAVRDLVGALAGICAAAAVAAAGFGVWALVMHRIMYSLIVTVVLWATVAWRPRLDVLSRAAFADLWPFASHMFLFGLFKMSVQNLDLIFIGAVLGPLALGAYVFAYRLVIAPMSVALGAAGTFLFASWSRISADPPQLRRAVLHAHRFAAVAAAPALAVVAVAAKPVVPAVFGAQWQSAVPWVLVLVLVAFAQVTMSLAGQVMKVCDRPGVLLAWSILFTALLLGAMALGAARGAVGLQIAMVTAYAVGAFVVLGIEQRLLRALPHGDGSPQGRMAFVR